MSATVVLLDGTKFAVTVTVADAVRRLQLAQADGTLADFDLEVPKGWTSSVVCINPRYAMVVRQSTARAAV